MIICGCIEICQVPAYLPLLPPAVKFSLEWQNVLHSIADGSTALFQHFHTGFCAEMNKIITEERQEKYKLENTSIVELSSEFHQTKDTTIYLIRTSPLLKPGIRTWHGEKGC